MDVRVGGWRTGDCAAAKAWPVEHASVALSWATNCIQLTDRIFRNLIDADGEHRQDVNESRLCVRVSLGTYKLFYSAGDEDVFIRGRTREREETLKLRALAREEERRRSRWLK